MAAVPSLALSGAKLEDALKTMAAKRIDEATSALFALLAEVEKDCETYSVGGTPPKELLHFKARVVRRSRCQVQARCLLCAVFIRLHLCVDGLL